MTKNEALKLTRDNFSIFDPQKIISFKTLEIPVLYTIVHWLRPAEREYFFNLANKIKSLDESLILTTPETYHMTIFSYALSTDDSNIKSIIEEFLCKEAFNFKTSSFAMGPAGINIALYPDNDQFVSLRNKLYESVNIEPPADFRRYMCWVSIARFTEIPNKKLLEYIEENFVLDSEIELSINTAILYKNSHKELQGAQEVWRVE
jgi:hypothetical protein